MDFNFKDEMVYGKKHLQKINIKQDYIERDLNYIIVKKKNMSYLKN
jgi:hypothetical protein